MKHTPNINYGQNLYWTSQSVDHSTALKQATKAWWDEVRLYRSKDVVLTMQIFNQGVGHFTQMAQAKANLVGCTVHYCKGTCKSSFFVQSLISIFQTSYATITIKTC
jgi:hypothetical protein